MRFVATQKGSFIQFGVTCSVLRVRYWTLASSEASEQALEHRVQDYESFNAKGSGLWPYHWLWSPLAAALGPFA